MYTIQQQQVMQQQQQQSGIYLTLFAPDDDDERELHVSLSGDFAASTSGKGLSEVSLSAVAGLSIRAT